jgi:tellurite resistance protein TehA-like permease
MAALRIRAFDLPPDVFAVVMATGIIAVAARDHRYRVLADALGGLATVLFAALAVALLARIATGPREVARQTRDPDVVLRMFTWVAGGAVLATYWTAHPAAVWTFAALAATGWLVLVPVAGARVAARPRAELRDRVRGAWLLPSVGTAGLATVAAGLAVTRHARWLLWVAVAAWALALVIYAAVTFLVAWRALVVPVGTEHVTPDSWILMGALAIATLAGAHIVAGVAALGPAGLSWVRPATIATWTIAGLWIPALLFATIWRADQGSGSLRFQWAWWSAVFPLGMFAAASAACALALHWRALRTVSLVFFWDALAAWAIVAVGFGRARFRATRAGTARAQPLD